MRDESIYPFFACFCCFWSLQSLGLSSGLAGGGVGGASPNTPLTGFGSPSPSPFMPRNTSVEDFLSLVESGDIPPPEVRTVSAGL